MHAPPAVPFVRSPLPWLGHGIAFGKDADALLQRLRARHGDAFTLLLGGKRMTFLLNPHDAPAFFKQSKPLVAGPISKEISGKAFGIDWSQYAVDVHEVQVPFDKSMRKSVIGPMTLHMQEKAAARLQALGRHQWQSGELFRFVAKLVFDAGGKAMLGDGLFDDPALFEEFLHFDKQFPCW
ncbi:MAG: cytochrome P450 [Gammaproteobacteria bacterium]